MSILVKDWNIDARVYSSLAHPSNCLAKFSAPDIWVEEVTFRNTQDQWTFGTNPGHSVISLCIKAINKLVMSEYDTKVCE